MKRPLTGATRPESVDPKSGAIRRADDGGSFGRRARMYPAAWAAGIASRGVMPRQVQPDA